MFGSNTKKEEKSRLVVIIDATVNIELVITYRKAGVTRNMPSYPCVYL